MATYLAFDDTWNGAAHGRGRWTLYTVDEETGEQNDVGARTDDEERTLEGRVFVSTKETTPTDILTIARSIDPRVVAVLDDDGSGYPGWTCLYERLPLDANTRRSKNSYAEIA